MQDEELVDKKIINYIRTYFISTLKTIIIVEEKD